MKKYALPFLSLLSVAIILSLACGGSKPMVQTEQKPGPTIVSQTVSDVSEEESEKQVNQEISPVMDEPSKQVAKPVQRDSLKDINFDFDRYELRPEAKEILVKYADVLKDNPAVKILIEGHCDEWGSAEYNMVLGEHRAKAAKGFLVAYGVAENRVSTVSYGKERPLDPGHTREAWARNRRAAFVVRNENKNIAMP
jgi:peptidoglycan-associated lipoprotein